MRQDHLIVGREDELARLRELLASAGPTCVVMDGEAGIGKTTIWRTGLELASEAGFTVLACQPAEPERALPFSALGDLLEPLLDDRLATLPRPLGTALDVALQRREATEPTQQMAVSRATLALLNAVRTPLLLAIDDVQWLDPPSERTLEFVLRRLADAPVRLLLARRSEGPLPVPLALDRALPEDRRVSLRLEPMSLGELDELLRRRLGLALPRPRLVQLRDVSGGNPFYALEIARSAALHGFRVPPTLAGAIEARLSALPPPSRDAVLLASAAGQPMVSLLERAAGSSDGLEQAIAAGVLAIDGSRARFTHPLLASVAYESATPWARRRAHVRLAAAAEGEERARNLALGTEDPDENVAAELARAATAAAARGGTDAAASLAEHAARLTPPASPAKTTRLVAAAEHHVASGDPASGRTILRQLVDEVPSGVARAEILWRLADSGGMDFDESIRLAEQALEEGAGEPAISARIHTALGVFTWLNGDLQRSLRHCREAAACAGRAGDDLLLAITLGEVGHAEVVLGMPVPESDLAHAIAIEEHLDDFPAYLRPSFQLGVIRMITDDPDAARPLLEAELSRITAAGDESARCGALFRLAELELRSGNWGRAARHAEESTVLARQAGVEQEQSVTLMIHGLVQAHIGNLDAARAAADASIALTNETGDRVVRLRSAGVLGFAALSEDDPSAAVEHLTPALDELRDMGTGELSISHVVHNHIDALVALGRLEEAEKTIELVEDKGRPTGRAWHEAVAARGHALVAAARGDFEAARGHLDRALVAHEQLPQPFELGRTLLAQGTIERRAKRRGHARAALTKALELFDQLGASLWAEKAAAELARIPGRGVGGGELSETERRVAALVASGLANKEIAAKMFITVRTVEGNLTRIYAKLGVRSRTELASRLARP